MEKNIYDLLNEVNTDIEEYEKLELTKLEEKKIMKKFSEAVSQNTGIRKNYKKYVGVAAAAILTFGAVGAVPSMATSNPTMYKIATFLGIEKNLAPYETIVGKEVTKEGITIRINEVILNKDKLLMSITTSVEGGIDEEHFGSPLGSIYMNGESISKGASGETKILDDGTALTLASFPLREIPEGDIDFKVQLTTPLRNVSRSPHWNFEFRANGEALKLETQVIELEKAFALDDGTELILNRYEANEVGQRIIYSGTGGKTGFVEVKGVDEKGNEIIFQAMGMFDGTGELILAPEYQIVAEEAECLTLTLYQNDQQVGESFEIRK